ncbi:hypothetical protein [Corynebacterium lowii]|uniref:Biotin synthase auxiliary protein n=1 Tax=Corynebacterium lowii TaxID=1544413 RepID=A0A0Q1E0Z8_9CORY|nr:hypothetical protein [Corynebacterium lowii]KQB86141.1 hypothetical protein Clow_01495 [Corynebacterium lowii]MDP9852614.1 hypothetical protein [Corynebacterium lowii]
MGELAAAVLAGDEPLFNPYTGQEQGLTVEPSLGTRAGYEAPRYCQICGRKMVVCIVPHGWTARCSRHGELDSACLDHWEH